MNSATDAAFVQTLLQSARPHPIAENPFVAALRRGECSRAQVRAYAEMITIAAIGFPRVLSNILTFCDRPEVRTSVLANLLEEEGIVHYRAGEGVVVDASRNHADMARRFAAAAGVTAEALERPRAESRWYAHAAQRGNWIGAFAYFAIGYEANVPESFRLIHAALVEHYGFVDDDLEFLTEHMTADERHGREAAELLATETSPALRQRAVEGARRGGMTWWLIHSRLAAT